MMVHSEYLRRVRLARRAILIEALTAASWNVTHAAAALRMQRSYLHRLMRELEIRRPVPS
jgi:transcriptional regulator of acetoin/glycerol metabolism